ncbi:hypothetical protein ACIBAI_28720 [Streptomyces sp. NPDC051041]|uniref:hypothetical protein n=1 Tax=Streptomyces sp. NPDC051041 TaxID=3365640 RepID=UPI0037B11A17
MAGRTREDDAAEFRGSLEAVGNWWAKWPAGGCEALVAQPRGRRPGEHQPLDAVERQAIRQAVPDHRPRDPGVGKASRRSVSDRRGRSWARLSSGARLKRSASPLAWGR